ncbi:MAG: TonB-dependent receptor domain-containing protein [Gemmatimonadales bacterium]
MTARRPDCAGPSLQELTFRKLFLGTRHGAPASGRTPTPTSAARPPLARLTTAISLLAAVVPAVGQAQARGGVEGRVIDPVGRPVTSAEVSVDRAGTPVAGRATTDAAGAWRITHLEPGLYRITVYRLGYRSSRQDVQVEPGRTVQLTFALELVPFTLDSLVVSGFASGISTTDAELGTKLTVGEILLLPTTLDLRQLIALAPGARPDHIWGGASDQANSYSLDGTTVNHPGLGGATFLPSPSWIETLEVRGLGAGADVGGAQGGLVEVVTLGGRNVLEGALRTAFESHRLNGSNLIPGEIGRELARRSEVDGQVRGPLVRDRLHFALFGHVIRQGELVLDHLPDRTGEFVPQPPSFRDHRWLAKLSWKPGGRDLLQGSLMGRHQDGDRVGQTGYEAADATERLRQWNVTGNLTWQRSWSPRSALTVRLGGYVARERLDPYDGPAVPGIELLTQVNPPRYQNTPFRTLSAPSSLGLTTTWTRRGRLAGLEHEVKLGGEYTRGSWYFQRRRNGAMSWRPLRTLGFDPGSPATWVYLDAIGTAWGGDVRLDSDVQNAAVFVQDHIAILPSLRFNPGLRFGWWTGTLTPAAGPRFTAVRDHALEPRIGVVADLDRRGGLVAKAHWGRYHQPMFAALFERVEGAGAFSDEEIWSYLGPAPGTPTQTFTLAERDALAAAGLFRFEEAVRLDQAGRVEGYRQPYVDQTVLSLEHAFGGRWKVGLVYVHRRNHDLVALVDRSLASNYTVVENVLIRDRFHRLLSFGGQPLVLAKLAMSNEDILWVRDLMRQGVLLSPGYLYAPPGLSAAELDALRYDPDFVLTNVREATRRFEQLQLRLDARYRIWWAGASATLSTLEGNFNVVTGPDDYTTGGPGPWVRLNEQYNFFGALNNQSRFEGKLYLGGLLPARFRGGVFFSYATGDRVTPTMLISPLEVDYAVVVPETSNPAVGDTIPFHPFLFRSSRGHRIFIQPRGSYRYQSRASLDLHLERSFPRGRAEVVLMVDGFNVLGDQSVTGIQTVVNAVAGFFDFDYGRVRSRVPPRTLRLGAGVRF